LFHLESGAKKEITEFRIQHAGEIFLMGISEVGGIMKVLFAIHGDKCMQFAFCPSNFNGWELIHLSIRVILNFSPVSGFW